MTTPRTTTPKTTPQTQQQNPTYLIPVPVYSDNYLSDTAGYFAKKQINKTLYNKFMNKWLYEDYPEIFTYLSVRNGEVYITKHKKSNFSSNNELILKEDYIRENILTSKKAYKILKKIIATSDLEWHDLPYYEKTVKHNFAKYIKKKIKY